MLDRSGTDVDWTQAGCAGHPTTWWFPERETGRDNHGRRAKRICATCPIAGPCLEAALTRNEEHGIWGGAGGDEMRALRRAFITRDPDRWAAALAAHLRNLQAAADGQVVAITNRNGPNATHGLRVTYNRGCRCPACRRAVTDERTAGDPPPLTASTGSIEWADLLPTIDIGAAS